MYIGRVLYWLFTGAVIGFGVIALASIGIPFVVLGVVLVVIGATRLGGAGLWAALVGFGGVPASILIWDVTSAPWACISPTGGALPNVSYYNCVDTPFGTLTTYHVLALGYGVVALIGLVWPLLYRLVVRLRRPTAEHAR